METFVSEIDLNQSPGRVEAFFERFSELFKTETRDVGDRAMDYILGGLHLDKKFVLTNIPKVVPDTDNQRLHHFVSESPWKKEPVIERLQEDASGLIGGEDSALVVDGVSFPKQGEKSVGVARQWCGNLGKVENCQVGVFLGLATPDGERTLIDERLFLPEDWIEDEECRKEAGVPENVKFKTKPELALEMIDEAEKNDVEFGWVNADSLYGRSSSFREKLNKKDIIYMVDIPKDTKLFLAGTKALQSEIEENPKRADKLEETIDSNQKKELELRETERGKLESEVTALRVHTNKNDHPSDREEWLLIRRDKNKNETKYFLSNAPPETTLDKLVEMSSTRYWIERAIEDGKSEIGMDDYQVRKWIGWHHHMTMTMLAMLLLLEMKIDLGDNCPDLTIQDVRDILQQTLPRRNVTKRRLPKTVRRKNKTEKIHQKITTQKKRK
ncbi:hypothetical protein AKJ55_00155 [candidate division MSBL1 archaeon SCGC-AAA382M17]|uniref:Transposase IS701-like DDE domain-containing protein n=1 Tax=candidate division MSBL1 archaeon SCGC-AAA382M17 TaxID=1698284 RepID=A0ABR5TK37_9EURY|nr:hypothetical protein AKJ55_00155 [candidate division MSBL1 archaeon SCGC-AAA382M17]